MSTSYLRLTNDNSLLNTRAEWVYYQLLYRYYECLKLINEYKAFVGIDWANDKHDLCVQYPSTGKREFSIIKHDVNEIDKWVKGIHKRYGSPIACSSKRLKYKLFKYTDLLKFTVLQ
ncbi:hypothetical protein A9Q81_24705 [Gammaproteobacteria bacterium 42_54_T18]|nr:hypothetical protein A9Q81_24705 [Gammaproteobacteria bacterium 42_54_T18]